MPALPKNTNASHRRRLAQDAVRLKVKGMRLLGKLTDIAKEAAKAEANIPALKLQADIYFGLLRKAVPDLRSLEITGDVTHHDITQLSVEELTNIAAGSGEGVTSAASGDGEPSVVH